MIRPGDRVFAEHDDDRPRVVSGIVAMSHDAGLGDFAVAIWAGGDETGKNYELCVLNEFGTKILERGCAFPPVPDVIAPRLREAFERAKEECANTEKMLRMEATLRMVADIYRQAFMRGAMQAHLQGAIAALREKGFDDSDIRLAIAEHLFVPIINGLPQRNSRCETINVKQACYMASLEELDQAMGKSGASCV